MLTHSNLLYQLRCFPGLLAPGRGDTALCLLPPWHVYQRACQYYVASRGATQLFSGVRRLREDLRHAAPDYFVCVPLVLETLRARVLAALRAAPLPRRMLAGALLAAAVARARAGRVLGGEDLRHARARPSVLELGRAWTVAWLLSPLNWWEGCSWRGREGMARLGVHRAGAAISSQSRG